MQPGDVYQTYADVQPLMDDFGFKPSTSIEEGLGKFVDWYKEYYGVGEIKEREFDLAEKVKISEDSVG